jgi:hypothetical protein
MFLSGLIFNGRNANDQHRTGCLANYTFRIAAKHGMGEAGSTVRGEYN